jgi:hypothetical protein
MNNRANRRRRIALEGLQEQISRYSKKIKNRETSPEDKKEFKRKLERCEEEVVILKERIF